MCVRTIFVSVSGILMGFCPENIESSVKSIIEFADPAVLSSKDEAKMGANGRSSELKTQV